MFKANKKNVVLVNEGNGYKDFIEWHTNSYRNNHLRCVAVMYWTKAGSAYDGNLARCEKEEALKDIVLIDDLLSNFKSLDWE